MTADPAHVRLPVAVLLATYNGAAFLDAQLDSLAAQDAAGIDLFWRDDGSRDGSAAIVAGFAPRGAVRSVTCVAAAGGQLGPARTFHALAGAAPARSCIAFCDQDDVWLPAKLRRALAALAAVPEGVPALYCARQQLVDAQLRPLATSMPLRRAPGFPCALTQNVATGCTVVMNPAAAALLRAAAPPAGTLHDWWSYLLVTSVGGQVLHDDEAVVLYRQHGGNLVGAPHSWGRRALAAVRRGPGVFMRVMRRHVQALIEAGALLPAPSLAALRDIDGALRGGPVRRLAVLWRWRLRRQNPLESALFYVWFLTG